MVFRPSTGGILPEHPRNEKGQSVPERPPVPFHVEQTSIVDCPHAPLQCSLTEVCSREVIGYGKASPWSRLGSPSRGKHGRRRSSHCPGAQPDSDRTDRTKSLSATEGLRPGRAVRVGREH